MQSQLPPELLDFIFLLLRQLDLASLRACSLVNHDFNSLVEPHLYNHITLTNFKGSHRSESGCDLPWMAPAVYPRRAYELFKARPHLAGHVRSLKISLGNRYGDHYWDKTFERVPPLLSALESVSIVKERSEEVDWWLLSRKKQETCVRAVWMPRIKEIYIEGIKDFPLEALSGVSGLASLSLLGVFDFRDFYKLTGHPRCDPDPIPILDPPIVCDQRPLLKELTLRHESRYMLHNIFWIWSDMGPDLSQLRRLRMIVSSGDDLYHAPVLAACAGSLKELELDPGNPRQVNETYSGVNQGDLVLPLRVNPEQYNKRINENVHDGPLFSTFKCPGPESRKSLVMWRFPFALSSLKVLEALTLRLNIKDIIWDPWAEDAELMKEALYTAPWIWTQRLLDGFLEGPPRCFQSVLESLAATPTQDSHWAAVLLAAYNSDPSLLTDVKSWRNSRRMGCGSELKLERLSLDITLNVSKDVLCKISWSPLASVLSRFIAGVPSLKRVDVRIVAPPKKDVPDWWEGGEGIWEDSPDGKERKWVVQFLEADVHLGPLVQKGIVHVSAILYDEDNEW